MNTGVGFHFLFQGIFPTQESNPGLLHCMWILYQVSYEGSPILNLKNQIQNVPNSSDGLGPSFPMSELNKALAYVHSLLAQESSLCYTLICLCQADLGSVSMRDPLWERGVKASHISSCRNGWEGWTDCLCYSS